MSSSLRSLVALTLSVAALPALAGVFDEDAVPGESPQEQYQMVRERDAKLLGAHAQSVRVAIGNPTGEPSAMGVDARVMPNDANPGASPTVAIARRPAPADRAVSAGPGASPVRAVSQTCSCATAVKG